MKKWITTDEWYLWMPLAGTPALDMLKSFPHQFAHIPERLAKRLEKAHEEMQRVQEKVDAYIRSTG